MRKYLIWFGLLWRAQLKRASFWATLLVMTAVCCLVQVAALPKSNNTKVLVCYETLYGEDYTFSDEVWKKLKERDSIFDFELVDSKEDLCRQVLAGKAPCGVVFEEGIADKVEKQKPKDCITYYCASFANTGEVAKETIFTAFFEVYGQRILADSVDTIFEEPSSQLTEELLAGTREYLEGDTLFTTKSVTLETTYDKNKEEQGYGTFPLRGTVALFVFLSVFLACGQPKDYFQKYLQKGPRFAYLLEKCVVAGLSVGIIGLFLLYILKTGENFGKELLCLLFLIAYSFVWSGLIRFFVRKERGYHAWTFAVLMVHLVITPVYFNLATYLPIVKAVRYVLPVGGYLLLF